MLAVLPEGLNYIFETCEIIETGDESELQFKVEGRVNECSCNRQGEE